MRSIRLFIFYLTKYFPANIYLFKVNDRSTKKVWNIFTVNNKYTRTKSMTSSMTSFWCFFVNFEHISHLLVVNFTHAAQSLPKITIKFFHSRFLWKFSFKGINPVDTGRKLNVHKTFRRRPGRLLDVFCTVNLRPVSTRKLDGEL